MSKSKCVGLVLLISALTVCFLYYDVVFHLNDYLFASKGDGLPNYFTCLYHIKYDTGYLNFNGMNYPYGESIFMVDCQPFLSSFLKFISNNIVDISNYSIGILNFIMLASLIICSLFVYLIIDYYRLPWYVSIFGAIAVTFLSSNIILLKFGHYALSYSCFFPASWYLLLKYLSTDSKIKYSVLILINTLFWFYIHNYLGLIILSFGFFVLFFKLLFNIKINLIEILSFIIQVILPTLIVYFVILTFDKHNGRIELPYGFNYRASIYSVFFPYYSWIKPLYNFFIDLSAQETESWCAVGNYIGFSTNIIIISVFFYTIYMLIKTRKWIIKTLLTENDLLIAIFNNSIVLFNGCSI